jgi:hypothetical protein
MFNEKNDDNKKKLEKKVFIVNSKENNLEKEKVNLKGDFFKKI